MDGMFGVQGIQRCITVGGRSDPSGVGGGGGGGGVGGGGGGGYLDVDW